jgi:hypothetical protein
MPGLGGHCLWPQEFRQPLSAVKATVLNGKIYKQRKMLLRPKTQEFTARREKRGLS